jgi:putative membrane protein
MKTSPHQILGFACACLVGTATSTVIFAADSSPPMRSDTAGVALKRADRSFIEKAAKDGLEEVEISRVVADRTSNPRIKEFAQMIVSDHETANDALATLASNRGVSLPAKGNESSRWEKKDAKDFDMDYLNKMISDHEENVRLFEKEAKDGEDPDTVAFARKILPHLQRHLEQASDLKKSLK